VSLAGIRREALMSVSLTTKLDAVNLMLESVWEKPVSSLEVSGVGSVAMAQRFLDRTNISVQTRGWTFNTDPKLTLTPDVNGKIFPPANTLLVDSVDEDQDVDVVLRGTQLYNRTDNTFTFTKPLKVKLVTLYEFEQIPQSARTYIALMAARMFEAKYEKVAPTQATQEEVDALRTLEQNEADVADLNVFTDSYSVANILCR
jgi:hypothetical protein